jgi:2-polyprenyl-3-methyl-5-hydroxy-6-metoxy-1,4-benzoquinol methylase
LELNQLDIVFLIDVLHHVPKKMHRVFIKNLSASLKPGCRLILKDINAVNPLVYVNKLHDIIFAGEIGNEISMQEANDLLQENGFEIIRQYKKTMYVYPHYTIIAKRK